MSKCCDIEYMWVYIKSEPCLWTVGFYDPKGEWHADSDHVSSKRRRLTACTT
jgi:hypothetical protein